MEAIERLLSQLGFAGPVLYAGTAYSVFAWLDQNASDEAKAALKNTMAAVQPDPKTMANAIVETFDRVYSRPLLHWRAMVRSIFFTAMITLIFALETGAIRDFMSLRGLPEDERFLTMAAYRLHLLRELFITNAISDYVALFPIRRWLVVASARPVWALIAGSLIGVAVVVVGTTIRCFVIMLRWEDYSLYHLSQMSREEIVRFIGDVSIGVIPTTAVFSWLVLFALGIAFSRILFGLRWAAVWSQWFLKDGKERPLKAVGSVAAVLVFLISAAYKAFLAA